MSNAAPISGTGAETGIGTRLRAIRRLSRGLEVLLSVLLALAVLMPAALAVIAVLMPSQIACKETGCWLSLDAAPVPAGYTPVSQMAPITRAAGFLDLVIAALAPFFVLFHLRALFRLYARGTVFAAENARQLKRIGLWLILLLPLKFVSNMVFRMFGGMDHAWLHAPEVYALVLGAIVFVIAQVMEVGHELEREQAEFV